MTARQLYEAVLIELNKENAPNVLLEDFNYFANKAVNQYINKRYNIYDINQQTTDDLRVLKATSILPVTKAISKYSKENDFGFLGATYEVELPSDYLHILNCICIYKVNKTFKCYNAGDYWRRPATRLTADAYSQVLDNFYLRPTYRRPYYYIHNVNSSQNNPTNSYNEEYLGSTDISQNINKEDKVVSCMPWSSFLENILNIEDAYEMDANGNLLNITYTYQTFKNGNSHHIIKYTSNIEKILQFDEYNLESGIILISETDDSENISEEFIRKQQEILGRKPVAIKVELNNSSNTNRSITLTLLENVENSIFTDVYNDEVYRYNYNSCQWENVGKVTDFFGNKIINNNNSDLFSGVKIGENNTSNIERAAQVRYGNASKVRLEVRYGTDDSVFTLVKVYIDYLKTPQHIRLTQNQLDITEDTSQMLEYPDYVCQEIVNELVHIIMENISDQKLNTHPVVSQSIANPVQQQTEQ